MATGISQSAGHFRLSRCGNAFRAPLAPLAVKRHLGEPGPLRAHQEEGAGEVGATCPEGRTGDTSICFAWLGVSHGCVGHARMCWESERPSLSVG